MTGLGLISYSVYLIHQPLLGLLLPEDLGLQVTGRVSYFLFAAVKLALVIAVGLGFYVLLKRP